MSDLFQKFLAFDFRNGPLRRRYDSVKYCVRRLEDLLYELSLASDFDATSRGRDGSDKGRGAAAALSEDFDRMKEAMEVYDKTREDVIKRTRDVQKLGKQAIFSLHRG